MPTNEVRVIDCGIKGVRLFELPVIQDSRGSLSFAEYQQSLPFLPKRYFIVFDVGENQTRGGHAHKSVHQLLVCVKGSCLVSLDDGKTRDEVTLDRPELALYIPSKIWATESRFTHGAVLMVLASEKYDPNEYIKDYEQFLKQA